MQIRSRRRRHRSCFQAVGAFPSSFPANDKLIRQMAIALSGATSEERILSVPRPNQQHGGRKFSGLTCSQLKVEIAHIGDNTSVRKNDICYRHKHIMWPVKNNTLCMLPFPKSSCQTRCRCQSQLRLTHSVRALFAVQLTTSNCDFTLQCVLSVFS